MSFVFISHASEDKPKVKSLVTALALLGVNIWVDRPGSGENNLGLNQDFISSYNIQGLRAGLTWDEQLRDALKGSGAVLGCFSKHVKSERKIIDNELVFSSVSGKLVACIIDDLPYGEIEEFGLARVSNIQASRINCENLEKAINLYQINHPIEEWPEQAFSQWEILNKIKLDIDQVLFNQGIWEPQKRDLIKALELIIKVPIGPNFQPQELPQELIDLFADKYDSSLAAKRHITNAMGLLWESNDAQFTKEQMLINTYQLPNLDLVGSQSFWTDAFLAANYKSRRTLAALILTPGRIKLAEEVNQFVSEIQDFMKVLREKSDWE